ncbi:MAG: UDP-N-acetylglucosamine 1-carboxyvinyltransferase [Deltaproteobacteria bacterium CG2_30_63_29]|nr:MAG: UDP-N-acetylglucosamine 1-carboxyvinyltransferase [Deltaproteobacteria bacterium CG2_30_63_29]PIV99361.1 MAG: UDP-N-acetylglucosamine 1-carboxyvinyltransferase [Deltaproteobacteria bacterium CG17_big_fil_post_rev_8_21_14_2_50_63_7]
MEKFVIEGGHTLSGSMRPGGNKNEALPTLAATLLTDEEVILKNVPEIADVYVMLEILRDLGAEAAFIGDNEIRVFAKGVNKTKLSEELCRRVRASILFAGPMIARHGHCDLPPPGGDIIGRRRLDSHFLAFSGLGASVEVGNTYRLDAKTLVGADIFMDEPSVTATENAVMAAVLARGKTTFRNVACEPHVQGLCRMLISMGAHIEGVGSNTLTIYGTGGLHGTTHSVGPDYLEVGSYVGLAAVTRSSITIQGARAEDVRMVRMIFEKLGICVEFEGDNLIVPAEQEMIVRTDLHNAVPKVDDGPWPAFPTDLMSIAITLATQCRGTMLFFEKMFEGRMFFVDSLISMGAQIILCDPHRVVVAGPTPLMGARLESPDVRAGMALLIAALAAKGTSTIYNIGQIDRGYEKVDQKLRSLGANIDRLPA